MQTSHMNVFRMKFSSLFLSSPSLIFQVADEWISAVSNFSHVLVNVYGLLKQSIYMLMFVDYRVFKLLIYK